MKGFFDRINLKTTTPAQDQELLSNLVLKDPIGIPISANGAIAINEWLTFRLTALKYRKRISPNPTFEL